MSKGDQLTPKDHRPYGARSMWGWPVSPGKAEPMGHAAMHAFPDLSDRSLCGKWKEGPDKLVHAQIKVKEACSKCLELHKRYLAGTWAPPPKRRR